MGEAKLLDFFSQRLCRTQGADQKAPGLFLALRGCLAFDARPECSSRAPGCCSRRALLWKCLHIQPMLVSPLLTHTQLC